MGYVDAMQTTMHTTDHHSNLSSHTRPSTSLGKRPLRRLVQLQLAAALTIMLGSGFSARASDPVGIYALLDKVVFEPNDQAPERVQLWGAFALAKGRGYEYDKAKKGFLYYRLNAEKPETCRKEWADLKSVAGTAQVVGFGSRWEEKGRWRKENEKAESPDLYPLGFGVTKVRRAYEPVKDLLELTGKKPGKKDPPAKPTSAIKPDQTRSDVAARKSSAG